METSNKNKFVRWIMFGVWEDADGNHHFDVPAIHALIGCPNTPEQIKDTREMLARLLREEHGIDVKIRLTPDQ